MYPALLAAAFRDGGDAGVFLQLLGPLEALAIFPEGDEQKRPVVYAALRRLAISIVMILAVAYLISLNKLSKLPSVVRLGANNRHVAGS